MRKIFYGAVGFLVFASSQVHAADNSKFECSLIERKVVGSTFREEILKSGVIDVMVPELSGISFSMPGQGNGVLDFSAHVQPDLSIRADFDLRHSSSKRRSAMAKFDLPTRSFEIAFESGSEIYDAFIARCTNK